MPVETKIDGLNDLLRNIDVLKDRVLTGQAAGMAQVCAEVANHARENHPFQNRTGNLEKSIQPLPVEIEDGAVVGYVRAGEEYAAFVEFGTSKSAPYPYMHPAIEANKGNLKATMAAVTERAQQSIKVEK